MTVEERLVDLEQRAAAVDIMLGNLAGTYGVYSGLNDRLRRGPVAGPGAHALTLLMFDLEHIMAVRVNAVLVDRRWQDDATLPQRRWP